jgi:AAA domain
MVRARDAGDRVSFAFRPAVRENVGLLLGLSGPSGSGKTFTAMRLAHGICGDAPFAVIDTEAGRAKHYADRFRFDHGDLTPPFTPERYADAITAADAAKYLVIVVDSMSHEWAGDGGILDWQEAELDRMAGTDAKRRDAAKMASWIKPKMAHKQMVQRLLQVRAHLILCFRAEPKIEMVRGQDGKMEIREKHSLVGLHGWIPIAEKNLPYELTASFLLLPDRPGVPLPIKLQEQHRSLFPLDVPITEASGVELAKWASGGTPTTARTTEQEWLAKMLAAKNTKDLRAVGVALKAAAETLKPEELTALRAAYDARLGKVSARKPKEVA